jgi:hypothetical protein
VEHVLDSARAGDLQLTAEELASITAATFDRS